MTLMLVLMLVLMLMFADVRGARDELQVPHNIKMTKILAERVTE